jgi:hypothetical protein
MLDCSAVVAWNMPYCAGATPHGVSQAVCMPEMTSTVFLPAALVLSYMKMHATSFALTALSCPMSRRNGRAPLCVTGELHSMMPLHKLCFGVHLPGAGCVTAAALEGTASRLCAAQHAALPSAT